MASKNQLIGENVLAFITGASRGIGRELVIQLAKRYPNDQFIFFLLARNKEGLEEVKGQIQKHASSSTIIENFVADLSIQPFCPEQIIDKLQILDGKKKIDVCLIVHNAGTLGDLTKNSSQLSDANQWHEYLQTNLISTIQLNNHLFNSLQQDDVTKRKIFIVNITSLLSVKAYPSFTQYSVGKAAREAYFRGFATENPSCRVLNYSPGPVDTDMHTEVSLTTYDKEVREVFSTKRHNTDLHRKLLTPEETVKRLIRIIEENKFENGARIDYFDKC